MCLKKVAVLIISILLLVNPVFGILAEEIATDTVVVPDKDGKTDVTVGGIDVVGNDRDQERGAKISDNSDEHVLENNEETENNILTVNGSVSVTNNYENQISYGNATGISVNAQSDESSTATVYGNVQATGTGTAIGIETSSDGDVVVDVTGEVSADGGQSYKAGWSSIGIKSENEDGMTDIDVGKDVKSSSDEYAVGVRVRDASAEAGESPTTDIEINGNILVNQPAEKSEKTDGSRGVGLEIGEAGDGTNIDIDVFGKVDVDAVSQATGVFVWSDYVEKAEAQIDTKEIDVSANNLEGEATAVGVHFDLNGSYAELTAHGNVSAAASGKEGTSAEGVHVTSSDGSALITVEGVVKAESDGRASGITTGFTTDIENERTSVSGSKADVRIIADGVDVKSTGQNTAATGVRLEATDHGKVAAEIGENGVKVEAEILTGVGLMASDGAVSATVAGDITAIGKQSAGAYLYAADDGKAALEVKGNVTSDLFGLALETDGTEEALIDVLIEGTLSGGGSTVFVQSEELENVVTLTVWEAKVNDEGTVVGSPTFAEQKQAAIEDENQERMDEIAEIEALYAETAKAIEKNIWYIIKVENPEGTTLIPQKEDGTALDKSHDWDVARETQRVILTVSDGYTITGAFNGLNEKVSLSKDVNGNYYVDVPKGGGIYLTATVNRNAEEPDSWERPSVVVKAAVAVTAESGASEKDVSILAKYSPEQQVAIILTKLGMTDAMAVSKIRIKELAKKAADEITSDLSGMITEEELTIDGETAVWKVITLTENGKLVKYCFRMLDDGTWMFKKI